MSPAEQPFDVRVTLTQEEAVDFLERLARNEDGILDRYPDDPFGVLRENGVEITSTAPAPKATAPSPADLEAAAASVRDEEWWWPWIWFLIPWIGRTPREEGEGYESA